MTFGRHRRHEAPFEQVEWLVIDDGSTNATADVARAHGADHVVRLPRNRGLPRAFTPGVEACLARGADVIVNLDADNQYEADDIPKLVEPILTGEAEIVVGSPSIASIEHFSPVKKVLQRLGSWVVRIVSRTDGPDASSGFRAMSRHAARQLNDSLRYYIRRRRLKYTWKCAKQPPPCLYRRDGAQMRGSEDGAPMEYGESMCSEAGRQAPTQRLVAELSVVIPTRDTRELTLRCLGSLGALDGAGRVEVLVVDDGSRDGTAGAVRERFPGVEVLHSESPRGFAVAANRGLARAAGGVVLLLNSDTEMGPGWREVLRDVFARDPGLGIAGARLHYPDGRRQWSGGRAPTLPWLFVLASGAARWLRLVPGYRRRRATAGGPFREVDWVTGAALAVRREVLEVVGLLDEGFAFYGQDLDLCLRAGGRGFRVGIVPELRVVHHHGGTIGRGEGAVGPQQPELLWRDLLRWAHKHRGPAWAARAAWALAWGARARLAGRALLAPFRPPSQRAAWRRDTLAYRRALERLPRPVVEA